MATPVNIQDEVYAQLWTVLGADPDWSLLVDPQNRLNYSVLQGLQKAEPSGVLDSDYPKASLVLRAGSTRMFLSSDETFATWEEGGPTQWTEEHQVIYRLEQVSQLMNITEPDTLLKCALNALRRAGPRIGISYVQGLIFDYRLEARNDDKTHDQLRWLSTCDINVRAQVDGVLMRGS